jgi:hypothetical protein
MITEKHQSEIKFLLKTIGEIEEKIRTDSEKRKAITKPKIASDRRVPLENKENWEIS